MRVVFRPNIPQDFTDIEAAIRYDEGFEIETDIRPMMGDELSLYNLLEEKELVNPELSQAILDLEVSVVTSTIIERDEKGIFLVANLDEEEDLFGFFSGTSSDKSELN